MKTNRTTAAATANGKKMLTAICESEYQGGGSPVGVPVWTFSVTHDFPRASVGGIIADLVIKGFAGVELNDGDDTVWITAEGLEQINS